MCETDKKGNQTEINCIAAFINLGYMVSTPVGQHERYDFIADVEGQLFKIQCKTARSINDGSCLEIEIRSTVLKKEGKIIHKTYNDYEVDYFATFYNGKCYLVPFCECGVRCKKLRLTPPLSNQIKNINWASDYELEKMIDKIINA